MRIVVKNRQKDLKIASKELKKALASFLEMKNVCCAEVIIHYVTKRTICQLHKDYFDDDNPTDCISLPIDSPTDDSPFSILGEVFVCPRVAIDYAAQHNTDPDKENLLYTVHGLLHLLGYDDKAAHDRKIMRREERKAMNFLERPLHN